MTYDVHVWWAALSAVALVNITLWSTALYWSRAATQLPASVRSQRNTQFLLSGIYVFVCAFRGFLPRADVQRICLVDSFFSSVFVGRSVATIAELAFALQWALFLRLLADATQLSSVRVISRMLVPLIVWAELASWYAVVSTNFLGNVLEQSTWTLCGGLIAIAYFRAWPHAKGGLRAQLRWTAPILAAFVWFMCTVDIPHYLAHWHADELAGRTYLGPREGLRDSAERWIVVDAWQLWRDEIAWMALYFSVGVWLSIAFTYAPALVHGSVPALAKRSSASATRLSPS